MLTFLQNLHNRTALVTGGTQGIGRAIVERFLVEGARVATVAREAPDERPPEVAFLPFDLADASGLPELVAAVENTVGPLDILVNNAGIWRETPALAMDPVDWSQVIAINLTAPVLLATLAARGMADRGYGRIVNVTSDPWALRGRISARLRRGQGRVGASHTQPCRRSRVPRHPRERSGTGVHLDPPQRHGRRSRA